MKKALLLMLTAMMILSTAACGKKDESSSASESSSSSVAEEQSSEDSSIEEESNEESVDDSSSEAENAAGDTMGQTLLQDFRDRTAADDTLNAQTLADAILTNPIIQFAGATMPVEQGLLTGFGNAEITGFKEGVMFAPAIGSIAFVGYVFELEDGTDAAAFMKTLEDNADPRWNICVEAEETIVEQAGNKVFFLMCPKSMEA